VITALVVLQSVALLFQISQYGQIQKLTQYIVTRTGGKI
jgi:hypothetical protein